MLLPMLLRGFRAVSNCAQTGQWMDIRQAGKCLRAFLRPRERPCAPKPAPVRSCPVKTPMHTYTPWSQGAVQKTFTLLPSQDAKQVCFGPIGGLSISADVSPKYLLHSSASGAVVGLGQHGGSRVQAGANSLSAVYGRQPEEGHPGTLL